MNCSEHSSKGSSPLRYISPASFLIPNIFRADSTWVEHAPFAFWLVEASHPKIIVALGCNFGVSYFVLCQAVQSSNLNTRCYGIDNWENVDQDGFCGENLFARVSAYNEQHYSSFSRVISSNVDEALVGFEERSIDLLYISADTYQKGRSCYERWRARISENGIVLLNNINDRERQFGVWKLWEELERDHRSFSFFHGGGLGLLGLGCRLPLGVDGLLRNSDSDTAGKVRLIYSRLGGALKDRIANEQLVARTHQMEFESASIDTKLSEAQLDLAQHVRRGNYLSAQVGFLKGEQENLSADIERFKVENQNLSGKVKRLEREKQSLSADIEHFKSQNLAEIKWLRESLSWRVTHPLREVIRLAERIAGKRQRHARF